MPNITPQSTDYSQWYLDVAKAADLFEYSPTPGCTTFLPKAVTMWDRIRATMQKKLDLLGVQNLLLPMLIPMSFFEREKDHIEWFSPELAVVTIGGGKTLEDPLAIRPTSELMFCDFFKNRLHSYRDLPLLYNQWVNVLRWEKRTRPFLRSAEFHWQEGHTLHETRNEADQFSLSILHNVYVETFNELMAIEGIAGVKSNSEKFAGADTTYTFEPMMSNGWALQICTSHLLAQWFMKGFDVKFQSREGAVDYPWYTSWGLSTRSIGGIISSHSDDKGLVIPPRMSEYMATILPIYGKWNEGAVNGYVREIAKSLIGHSHEVPVQGEYFRAIVGDGEKVLIDQRNVRLGEKITDWEQSGYPVRIECGERDMEAKKCVVVSRITGEKIITDIGEIQKTVLRMHEEWQSALRQKSRQRLIENTVACNTLEDIGVALESWKFALYAWDRDPKLETVIKDRWKWTTRCLPFDGQFTDNILFITDKNLTPVIIARSF